MAKFRFDIDPSLVRKLERLEKFDEYAPKILEEGAKVLEPFVKREVGKHVDSGELVKSIKISKPKENEYGWFITVRPTGYSTKGSVLAKSKRRRLRGERDRLRNMDKLMYLEFGTKNQPARPVLTKALNDAREPVIEKMQIIMNKIIEEE